MLPAMSRRRSFRLASLRRAPGLAGLMLVVFLMRMGITMTCEPHEFAEWFGGAAAKVQTLSSADDTQGEDLSDHGASDHCRQCSCHHGVTLSSPPPTVMVMTTSSVVPLDDIPRTDVPLQRELRPPIV